MKKTVRKLNEINRKGSFFSSILSPSFATQRCILLTLIAGAIISIVVLVSLMGIFAQLRRLACINGAADLEEAANLPQHPKTVAVLITGTGNYFKLALQLVDSGRRYFCRDDAGCSNVTYFIFTDEPLDAAAEAHDTMTSTRRTILQQDKVQVEIIRQPRLGWPNDSMKRFHNYLNQLHLLQNFDFVLALDADVLFVKQVLLQDIYSDLVAVLHPGYVSVRYRWKLPYERDERRSEAYVPLLRGCRYFTGAIWGGKSATFIRALRTLVWQLDTDAARLGVNFSAKWHDESHLNRYFVDNIPTRVLSPAYYYPQRNEEYPDIRDLQPNIIALDKDHKQLRGTTST